jgi:hypothetical protein
MLDEPGPAAVSHAQRQKDVYLVLLDHVRKQRGSSSPRESKMATADVLDLVFAEGTW